MHIKAFLLSMKVPERVSFAQRCGTSYAHLRNIAYGLKPCAAELAVAVERESGGKVRCEPLCPNVDWNYVRSTAGKHTAP